ncbi:MAG: helix-turn-helix transcriptional regulator [Clostridia bacterium]|nr:helix-turn-helix transcriptional regulator [Clostridia bacterium]
MKFEDLKVKDISAVFHYDTHLRRWHSENRPCHIVGLKLQGAAFHDFGYKKFVLSRNSVFFFNQRDVYDVEVEEPGSTFVVHFTTYEDIETDSFVAQAGTTAEIESILDRMEKLSRGSRQLSLMSLFYKLCDEISRTSERLYHKRDERITHVREYLDTHFRESGALDGAASVSGLSRRRFGELFKNDFDITPNRYIQIKRIEYSKELLAFSELSIGEIAALCGFSDIYYFSKRFKLETGKSPQNYKKSLHIA